MKSAARIHDENYVAGVIQRNRTLFAIVLSVAVVLSLFVNIVLVYGLLYRYPLKQFLWTSDAQAVCAAIPLTEPNISAARVKDFAATTAVTLNSYDYINWRRTVDAVLTANFTPAGRVAYKQAWQDTGIIQRVERNFYVVTAITNGDPIIAEEGRINGRYYWRVEVPVTVYYRTNVEVRPENRVFVFTLIRIEPSPINTNGIAVDGVVSHQMTRSTQF